MCPRAWSGADVWSDDDELPLERMQILASFHGILADVLTKISYVEH